MRKAVTIQFGRGGPPNRRFILQTDVYTDILLHPKYLHFGSVALNPDTLVARILTVENTSDQPLVCRKIYADADAVHAAPDAMIIAPGESSRIEVSLRPSEAGRWTYYLNVDTDHTLKSRLRIPVFAHVR